MRQRLRWICSFDVDPVLGAGDTARGDRPLYNFQQVVVCQLGWVNASGFFGRFSRPYGTKA